MSDGRLVRSRSHGRRLLALQHSWLFRTTAAFQNIALWVLVIVEGYMLFWWRGEKMGAKRSE